MCTGRRNCVDGQLVHETPAVEQLPAPLTDACHDDGTVAAERCCVATTGSPEATLGEEKDRARQRVAF
jgi:hypothetical protein